MNRSRFTRYVLLVVAGLLSFSLTLVVLFSLDPLDGQNNSARQPVERSEAYVLTRRQLSAMHTLLSDRGHLIFAWDWKPGDPWEWQPNTPPNATTLNSPVYGFDGHAWWTTDATLETLHNFPDIQYLHLAYCCRISDRGIAQLKELRSLKTLVLYRNSPEFGGNLLPAHVVDRRPRQVLTDKTLEHISQFPALESLHIEDNKFTEAGIMKLANVKTLKVLGIDDSQISEAGLARLRSEMPNCKINVMYGRRVSQ